jgi:acyl carrier protein
MALENNQLLVRIQEAVAEALQVPVSLVTPDLKFGGIKAWDSMGHMGVMMLLEERFRISIDAEIIGALTSISAICDHIQKTWKE